MPDKVPNGSKHTNPGKEVFLMDDGQNGYGKRSVYVETIDQPRRTEGGAGFLDIWHLLRSHLGLITAIGVLGSIGGGLLTLYETPQYRARTTVELQPPATPTMGFASATPGEADSGETYIRTQTKVLLSQTLRERVLAKLKSTNRLSSYSPPDRLAALRRFLRLSSPPRRAAARGRIPAFEFKVTSDTTHIVELSCDSEDPKFSADYVNTVADEFTQMQLETRWDASKRTTAWLNDQMAEMKRKVEDGEARLRENAVSSGIMITDGKDAIPEDKLKEIQTQLSTAIGERIHYQSIYEIAGKNASAVEDERLNTYQTDLSKMRQQLAELKAVYTDEYPQVKRLKAQITDQEAMIKHEQASMMARIREDYLTAQRREDLLKDAYAAQSKIVLDHASRYAAYDILKREVDTDRELYSALLQKVRESGVTSAFSTNNVHVVDRAAIPSSPYRPSMKINVAGGLLTALALGIGLVILGDQVNRSLKAPGETSAHLRVPELGVIPAYVASPQVQSNGAPKMLGGAEQNGKRPSDLVELVMRNDAQSLVAESFRNVLTSILLSDSGEDRPRVIVMTAAGRQAGKSSSVSNLALALAEIGQKVLVIDADLRRPKQHLIFDTSNSWGLTDILQERTPLKDCPLEVIARPLESPGLYLLPSGPPCANVSSLLYSSRVSELLQRVRREFDTVLIDTPPVLMVADARVVGRLADASILVIRAGDTTRDMAFQAKQRLVDDGIVVLGTILNQWRLKARVPYSNYNYASTRV